MLVFGLIADLLIGAFRVTRFERQKVEAAEAGQLALTRMLCEVREACKIETPILPEELTLYKFNATQTVAASSELNRYKYLLKIRYYRDSQGALLRDVSDLPPTGTATHVVADGIQGISFAQDPVTKNIQISISVDVKGTLRTLSSEVTPLAVLP